MTRKLNIKPIPTQYKGYQFRSRLEARWAVFFDEMRIPYDYENEGYEVATGVWYLPDFKIDNCYVEVKHRFDDDMDALEKIGALVSDTRVPGVIVYGDPYAHLAVLFEPHTDPPGYVRTVANFLNIRNSIDAAVIARQATFQSAS